MDKIDDIINELISKLSESLNKKDRVIFQGTASSNSNITINTTWDEIGKFKNLVVEISDTANNGHYYINFPWNAFTSNETSLNGSGKFNTNVISPLIRFSAGDTYVHIIPFTHITSNTIKFDWTNASACKIRSIVVQF